MLKFSLDNGIARHWMASAAAVLLGLADMALAQSGPVLGFSPLEPAQVFDAPVRTRANRTYYVMQSQADGMQPLLPETVVEGSQPTEPEPEPTPNPLPQPEPEYEPNSPFNTDYALRDASLSTKTNTPLREIPASIVVVPQQVIRDQAAYRIEDIYLNASGVVQSGNTLNAQSVIRPYIRGFESNVFFRNGLRATAVGSVELLNIQSVEFLKGPASILYGAVQPGGILSYTTKRPFEDPYYNFRQQGGSWDNSRTTIDLNEPLNDDRTALFRINGAYTNYNSFRDYVNGDRVGVAPTLMLLPTENTVVLADFSYSREWVPYDNGVPIGLNNQPLVPSSANFNAINLRGRDLEDFYFALSVVHQFDFMPLTWRSHLLMRQTNAKNETLRPRGGAVGNNAINAGNIAQRYQNEEVTDEGVQFVSDLLLESGNDNFGNTIVAGIDLLHEQSTFSRFRTNAVPQVKIVPNPYVTFTPPTNQPQQLLLGNLNWVGGYVQDQITLGQRFHVLLGGRADHVETNASTDGVSSPEVSADALTGRVGVLYDLTDVISPYFSVSQSFVPQGSGVLDQNNNPLNPETGLQYEMGLKMVSTDQRLWLAMAFYQIKKNNVAVADPTGTFSLPGVSQQSQGFELDMAGELSPTWKIIGNYAYTDTEVTGNLTNPAQIGQRLGNVPLHVARAWITYTAPLDGNWTGFGIGGGPRYQSSSLAFADPSVVLGDFLYFDMGLWYRRAPTLDRRGFYAQVNFFNLFDTDYYVSANTRDLVHPGAPFNVLANFGWEY